MCELEKSKMLPATSPRGPPGVLACPAESTGAEASPSGLPVSGSLAPVNP